MCVTRGGQNKARGEPERRCIVTGETQPKRGLIRFVVGPEGSVVPDILGKLPGRGIWISAERDVLESAIKKRQFARAGKTAAAIPDDLVSEVERQLVRRMLDLVSMSRKTGTAVAGFEKVKSWLADGRAKVLMQASDGSERGKGKLWTPEGGRFFGMLTASELGLAFGRESVIHGALGAGGLTARVVEEATRLTGFREIDGGKSAGKGKTTK